MISAGRLNYFPAYLQPVYAANKQVIDYLIIDKVESQQ